MKKLLLFLLFTIAGVNAQVSFNPLVMCEEDTDGFAMFDLYAGVETQINNPEDYIIEFYLSAEDFELGLPIPATYMNTTAFQQEILVHIADAENPETFETAPLVLIVGNFPVINDPADLAMCDDFDGVSDGQVTLDLTIMIDQIIEGLQPGYNITFHATQADANTGLNILEGPQAFVASDQQIFVRVADGDSPCYATTSFEIHINDAPAINHPHDQEQCAFNGTNSFNLLFSNTEITMGNPALTVSYYEDSNYEIIISNPTDYSITTSPHTVYVRVQSVDGCTANTTLTLNTVEVPNINFDSVFSCNGIYDLTTVSEGISEEFEVSFYISQEDAASETNPITLPQAYETTAESVWIRRQITGMSGLQCSNIQPIWFEGPGELEAVVMLDGSTLNVNASGYGAMQYKLDNGDFQESDIFENVPYGVHTITITDECGRILIISVEITPAEPTGNPEQEVIPGATLANLEVEGENIQWYDNPGDVPGPPGDNIDVPLPLTTILVDGTTYYASQTIDGVESAERLGVKVHFALANAEHALAGLTLYPNPVKDVLTISGNAVLDTIRIHTILGQQVASAQVNSDTATIDMRPFENGVYILTVNAGNAVKTVKVIKQ